MPNSTKIVGVALLGLGLLIHAETFAQIDPFWENFEDLQIISESALSDESWLVFYNVFDGNDGTFLFGFGPFPAPNAAASNFNAFSAITSGEGGIAQGQQQLSVFSDYQNSAHMDSDLVEAIFFRQTEIGESNVGQTWIFRFDYKIGDLVAPSRAFGFIQTLDPNNGFAQTNLVTHETTDAPATWINDTEIFLTIDASLVGSFFQFGFFNTATNYDGSSVYYDNLELFVDLDADGDGIPDNDDNCTNVANASQIDADSDGYGNQCDADFNNDCTVNTIDLGRLKAEFFGQSAVTDLNGDGVTNAGDLGLLRVGFFGAPGPSGLGDACGP